MKEYEDALRVRDARARYFESNGFGDGGYDAKWVKLALGPIPFAFPNGAARVRAVRLHDLHHVATGYDTNVLGEAEIGAWEIGSSRLGLSASAPEATGIDPAAFLGWSALALLLALATSALVLAPFVLLAGALF